MKAKYSVNLTKDVRVLDAALPAKYDVRVSPKEKYSLDEAIRLTENGKFHFFIVVFAGLALMGAIAENVSMSFVLPYAKCDLQLTTSEQGLLSTILYLGIVLSSHLWGFLADTWGRRKVIRLSAGGAFLFSALCSCMTTVSLLVTCRFFVGFFVAGIQSSVFSYVSEFHVKEKAPRAAAFASIFMPLSLLFLALMGFLFIPINIDFNIFSLKMSAWRIYLFSVGAVNLFNFVAFMFLPESPKFLLSMDQSDETLDVLRMMYTNNTGELKESYPVKELEKESSGNSLGATKGFLSILKLLWKQTSPIFLPPHLDNTLKLCFMIFVLFAIGHGAFLWLPDFLVELQNNNEVGKTLCGVVGHERLVVETSDSCDIDNTNTLPFQIIFAAGGFFTIISAFISFYLDKIGPRILVPTWLIVSALCSLGLVFLTEFYLIVLVFVIFLSCSLCASIVSAISVSLYPTKIRGLATSFVFLFGRIGSLAGGNLVGLLVENNCDTIFYSFAAMSACCVVVFLLIKKVAENNTNRQSNVP